MNGIDAKGPVVLIWSGANGGRNGLKNHQTGWLAQKVANQTKKMYVANKLWCLFDFALVFRWPQAQTANSAGCSSPAEMQQRRAKVQVSVRFGLASESTPELVRRVEDNRRLLGGDPQQVGGILDPRCDR